MKAKRYLGFVPCVNFVVFVTMKVERVRPRYHSGSTRASSGTNETATVQAAAAAIFSSSGHTSSLQVVGKGAPATSRDSTIPSASSSSSPSPSGFGPGPGSVKTSGIASKRYTAASDHAMAQLYHPPQALGFGRGGEAGGRQKGAGKEAAHTRYHAASGAGAKRQQPQQNVWPSSPETTETRDSPRSKVSEGMVI